MSRKATHTHETGLRTPPASGSSFVEKERGSDARVMLSGSLGFGGKGYKMGVGEKSTDERVDTWIQQQKEDQPTAATAHVTAAVLCPRCC